MFLIFLILIRFSFGNQCPLSNYCTCSSDITVIECTHRRLTNDLLLKLNSQLPKSTIVLNLSSNSLTSIKSLSNLNSLQILDLSFNKIRYLPSNIASKFPQLTSLNLQNNSLKSIPKSFKKLPNLNLNLSNNQFHCTCQLKAFKNTTVLKNLICQNNKPFDENDFCPGNKSSLNANRSVLLNNSSTAFCQSIQMNTSKGYFYWPRTLINTKNEIKCPFGSAAWLRNSNEYARAWYTCSSDRKWIHFDVSQCAFQTNISRIFDQLSLNDTTLLLDLVKYLTKINRDDIKLNDIILLIDLIEDQQEKYQNQDRIMLIYHLTDFILQIKQDFRHSEQYRIAITRLRLIIERLLDLTNQSWLYIGKKLTAMTIQSPLSSTLCSIPNRSLLTIICDIDNQRHESELASIQFPSDLNKTNQYSLYRIIFYRQSKLFTGEKTTGNNNPVIYIRPVSTNHLPTIKLTFSGQFNEASIRIWNLNQTSWQIKSSICKINEQNNNSISTNCILSNNNSFSITYFNEINTPKSFFIYQKYSQLVIYISSIISSICLFTSILFYLCFHKNYQIPRHCFHCLINYWFSLGILLPLFAFGIEQTQYIFLCQFIAICLYYLCLTTIVWLTLLTYSIWRKLHVLSVDKDSYDTEESKPKPVIQFYLLAYGTSLIICGINVAVSHEQYMTDKICFLNHFDSILILIISMLIFIILLLIILLSARNYIKHLTNKTLTFPDKSEDILSSKPNETLPILPSSNLNNEQDLSNINYHHLNIDDQQESINQLLSILSQLILLIFLFLSSLTIYLHPLHSFKLSFENIIYSHLYGFFALFISFYILSFYMPSRYYFNRKRMDHLSNQIYIKPSSSRTNSVTNKEYDVPSVTEQTLPSHSHYASTVCVYEAPPNTDRTLLNDDDTYSSKRLTNVTAEYYVCHTDIDKTNETSSSQNILDETLPVSSVDTSSQETIDTHQSQCNSLYERSSKRSINIPIESRKTQIRNPQLHSSSLTSYRSLIHARTFPCRAIIRPLPITRVSARNTNKNLSNSIDTIPSNNHRNSLIKRNNVNSDVRNSYCTVSSPSIEEHRTTCVGLNKTNNLSQHETSKKPPYSYTQVVYIDDDDNDERSVSLKSLTCDSETSSSNISTRKNRSRTLSSSSSECSIDFDHAIILTNKLTLYESTV